MNKVKIEKKYGYATVHVNTWGNQKRHLHFLCFEQTSRSSLRIWQGKRCIGAVLVEDLKEMANLMKVN